MVESWTLAEGKNGILKIRVDDVRCLHGELPAGMASDDRGREHELLEWLQAYAVHEPCQIEGTEHIPFALINSVSESVCKGGVAC